MGRIKTKLIKRKTHAILEIHRDKFTEDFEQNKKIVDQYVQVESKKLRNSLAGFITRLKKKEEVL